MRRYSYLCNTTNSKYRVTHLGCFATTLNASIEGRAKVANNGSIHSMLVHSTNGGILHGGGPSGYPHVESALVDV